MLKILKICEYIYRRICLFMGRVRRIGMWYRDKKEVMDELSNKDFCLN